MVSVNTLPKPGDTLNLIELHKATHNLALSRRKDVGFWDGTLETAWAGFVFACHSEPNRDDFVINSIKGELLGDKRPTNPQSESELAACYMVAAFLQKVNLATNAKEFIVLADDLALKIAVHVDQEERFHLFSTPEYLYAIVLAHDVTSQPIQEQLKDVVSASLNKIREAEWYQSGYIFALGATAYLIINGYSEAACKAAIIWLFSLDLTKVDETSVPVVWFLEKNWDLIRPNIDEAQQKNVDEASIVLRSKLLHSLEQFDIHLAWQPPTEVVDSEPGNDGMIISTIELLMLDEIAEKHSQQSLVLTQEEIEEYRLLSTVFEQYKRKVDDKLLDLGLGNYLEAAYAGFAEDNPASWQQAMLGCRNLFYKLADVLWQIPGDEYRIPELKKPLSVKPIEQNARNRLTAYLHFNGVSKNKEPVFIAQFEAVSSLMHALVGKLATAKSEISRDEASALLMAFYVLLAEMIALTDLKPAE